MRLRRLSTGETALAQAVFGAALDPARVRVLNGAPTGGWAMVVFGLMLFPTDTADFAAEPMHLQGWFVHELTHILQFQTRPLWTVMSWARVAVTGGYLNRNAYRYRVPLDWPGMNLEQQAKVVEHGFLLARDTFPIDLPIGVGMRDFRDLNAVIPGLVPGTPGSAAETPKGGSSGQARG